MEEPKPVQLEDFVDLVRALRPGATLTITRDAEVEGRYHWRIDSPDTGGELMTVDD